MAVETKCLTCGKKLRRYKYWEIKKDYDYDGRCAAQGFLGYNGCGYFCTQSCGHAFALAFARAGHRLKAREGG